MQDPSITRVAEIEAIPPTPNGKSHQKTARPAANCSSKQQKLSVSFLFLAKRTSLFLIYALGWHEKVSPNPKTKANVSGVERVPSVRRSVRLQISASVEEGFQQDLCRYPEQVLFHVF